MTLSQKAIEWAAGRKLSKRTLEAFCGASGMRIMGDLGKTEVICLPYRRKDKIVNTKYRALSEKKFNMKEGGELRFWNLDAVLSQSKIAYIFEGECDAMAGFEGGLPIDTILSVPNGAPEAPCTDPEQQDRYRYVIQGLEEGLSHIERFVIATDNDGPGFALRQDLVNILGAARCWFIEWPTGIKDANAFLEKCGPGELLDYLEGEPKEWPVSGLYRLSQIPEPSPIVVWRPGFPEWESKIGFAPGMLSVLTGYPGHGKTLIGMQMWFNMCRDYELRAAVASFETSAKPHHRRNLRQFWHQRPQMELTDQELKTADTWIEDHFLWINHPDRRPSFGWFLDLAEVAVIRHGAKIVQIDPWNKLEADRPPDVRETDWIRDCLNQAMSFAKDFNVHFQILAHPAKSMDVKQRSARPVLEDIAGSRHWENIVDQGLAVFRPKVFEDGTRKTEASLFHLKSRFEEIGHPCKLDVEYDLKTCSYRSIDYRQSWEG